MPYQTLLIVMTLSILAIGIYITHAENVEDIKALEKYIDHYALLAEEADLSAAPQIKALHILIKTLISEYEVVIEQLESRGIKIEDILRQVENGN